MQIVVKLRNTSPIYSAAPGAATVSIDGVFNPPGGGFPVVRARKTTVLAPTPDDTGVRKAYLPIVPGNTMRNLLRRIMLKETIEPALLGKSNTLSIGAYVTAYAGNATGNPDGVPSSFDEIATMRQHPFIGLFGGGPRMLRGRLSADNLYPIHQDALRIIGEDYLDEAASDRITDLVWQVRKDPVEALTDTQDTQVITSGSEAANAWIQAALAASTQKKAGKAKDTDESEDEGTQARGIKAMNAHEVVVPGVSWLWRVSIDRPTEAQAGLVLASLSKLNHWPVAGGNSKGYGKVELEGISVNGQCVWSAGQFDDSVMPYFDALADALGSMDASEFETFAASQKKGK